MRSGVQRVGDHTIGGGVGGGLRDRGPGSYMYTYCIDCQSSILPHKVPELINSLLCLLELQRLHRKIHRFRTVQIHHSLVAGSVPRSWLNASLLAQRLVAGSIFLTKKNEPATCP